jgi:hypothetical protein
MGMSGLVDDVAVLPAELSTTPSDVAGWGIEGSSAGLTGAFHRVSISKLTGHNQALTVYNVSVETDHSYVVEGIVAHNCEACWAMDGQVFDLDVDGPDDHQNGRCTRTPVTKTWRELGFDVDEPEDQRPNAEDVFRGLTEDQQLKIMGPTRLAGLNDGTIAWADLAQERTTTGWRRSFTPTPVRDLIPA